jgi:hypothetical protein
MALKLSELVNETRDTTVDLCGETVSITFYAHDSSNCRADALSSGRVTAEQGKAATENPFKVKPFNLALRLKSWDLKYAKEDGTEELLALNADVLADLRDKYFEPLWEAVFPREQSLPTEGSD